VLYYLNDEYKVIVDKSTVPVGTADKVRNWIKEKQEQKHSFNLVSNPEFLREGFAVDDFLKPDRIVVGVDTVQAEKIMQRLYKPFLLNGHPLLFMDITGGLSNIEGMSFPLHAEFLASIFL